MNDYAYVTQQMWDAKVAEADRLRNALEAAMPTLEAAVPKYSTAGTAISIRDKARTALAADEKQI